jgi:hypothetical protein
VVVRGADVSRLTLAKESIVGEVCTSFVSCLSRQCTLLETESRMVFGWNLD